jgi:hypothetical protein
MYHQLSCNRHDDIYLNILTLWRLIIDQLSDYKLFKKVPAAGINVHFLFEPFEEERKRERESEKEKVQWRQRETVHHT